MSIRGSNQLSEIVENGTCPSCGEPCQLTIRRWTNTFDIEQRCRPDWRCKCGFHWCDRHGSYESYEQHVRDIFWAPHYWLKEGDVQRTAEEKKLAHGLSRKRQVELVSHLNKLGSSITQRWAMATEASSNSAFLRICRASRTHRFRIFDQQFRLYWTELVSIQSLVIHELEQVWVQYEIPAADREWVPNATNFIWNPIHNAPLRWIIESLAISADATMWIAPTWLYFGQFDAMYPHGDQWDATQRILKCLCASAQRKLFYEREQNLNDVSRGMKLRSKLPSSAANRSLSELHYRSVRKRAVLHALILLGVGASDLEVCQFIDANETIRFDQEDWKVVYRKGNEAKHRIEVLISEVRNHLRGLGILT